MAGLRYRLLLLKKEAMEIEKELAKIEDWLIINTTHADFDSMVEKKNKLYTRLSDIQYKPKKYYIEPVECNIQFYDDEEK